MCLAVWFGEKKVARFYVSVSIQYALITLNLCSLNIFINAVYML